MARPKYNYQVKCVHWSIPVNKEKEIKDFIEVKRKESEKESENKEKNK